MAISSGSLFTGRTDISWEEGSLTPVARVLHTAVLLNNQVYVAGCYDGTPDMLHKIDIYDIINNSWSSITVPFSLFALAAFNGHLITIGGKDDNGEVTSKLFRSSIGHTFEIFTTMATPRYLASAIGYQRLLIIVGGKNRYTTLSSTEMFDSTTGRWYICEDLPQPHSWQQCVVANSKLYLLGGFGQDGTASPAVYSTNLDDVMRQQFEWNSVLDIPWYHPAAVCISERLVILGGANFTSIGDRLTSATRTKSIQVYNEVSNCWDLVGNLPLARGGPAAVNIDDDRIIVLGGRNTKGQRTDTVWIMSSPVTTLLAS